MINIFTIKFIIFSISFFIILLTNIDLIFSFLDKDPTLTGRTDFWPYIIDYIYQRPLFGWGFAAFFVESNQVAAAIFATIGFGINEAHNGILQLFLDVGFVGAALFLFLWVRNVIWAMKCINGPAPATGVSALALLLGILLIGVTEQVLTTSDGLTAEFFLLGFLCEKEVSLSRRTRSAIVLRSAPLQPGELVGSQEGEAV